MKGVIMPSLYLTDIIKRAGLDPSRVKLIRHSFNHKAFRDSEADNMVREYTSLQKENFSKDADYWMIFLADQSTLARFLCCYKVNGCVKADPSMCPKGFTHKEMYEKGCVYDLEETDIMADLSNRLVIEWGRGTISWAQKATNEKEVVAIKANEKKVFTGFETVCLKFEELKEIVDDPAIYENWYTALSSVNAIYLISDLEDGQLYVGSAYNKDGLLGRWREYIQTKHGGNKLMKEKLKQYPERYKDFQFSVLQILPKNLSDEQVIQTESLWKKKLSSLQFGMNDN